jgi:hypothetical protein
VIKLGLVATFRHYTRFYTHPGFPT